MLVLLGLLAGLGGLHVESAPTTATTLSWHRQRHQHLVQPHRPPRLFVVLSGWRTGSTLLAHGLAQHREVAIQETEWFGQKSEAFAWLGFPAAMRPLWQQRFSQPQPYIDAAVANELAAGARSREHGTHSAVIGHKFQLQYVGAGDAASRNHMGRKAFDAAMGLNSSWTKVVLYRCDVLAQYVSFKRAMKSNEWISSTTKCTESEVTLDLERFARWKEYQDYLQLSVWTALSILQKQHTVAIGYESHLRDPAERVKTLATLWAKLGVEPPTENMAFAGLGAGAHQTPDPHVAEEDLKKCLANPEALTILTDRYSALPLCDALRGGPSPNTELLNIIRFEATLINKP